jgi:hypothetical protein
MGSTIQYGRRIVNVVPSVVGIAGMSRAAVLVVTWVAHGLATGDHVSFIGITTPNNAGEWIALNGNSYPITKLTADTFSIPVNSAAFTAAYVDGNDAGTVGADFDITRIQGNRLPMKTVAGVFTVGETVTQATSGATGIVSKWMNNNLVLSTMTGVFDITHTVTGGTSGATAIPAEVGYAFSNGIRLSAIDFKPSGPLDTLLVREKGATGPYIMVRGDASGSGIHKATGGRSLRVKPYLLASEQTWGTPGSVLVSFEYD